MAEDHVEAMIGGAVTGALEAQVPPEAIRAAVQRAIRRHTGEHPDARSGDEILEELRAWVERIGA